MSRLGYLGDAWGSETSPSGIIGMYQNEINAIVPGAAQAAAESKGPYETAIDALFRVANNYTQTMQQRRMLEQQYQQAQQGLPPLPVNASGNGFQLSGQTVKILAGSGIALGIWWFMKGRKRGRR